MPIDLNWNRWIFASASVFFQNTINQNAINAGFIVNPGNQQNFNFIIEGQKQEAEHEAVEFRLSGPYWQQMDQTRFGGFITINILVKIRKDERDFHKIYRFTGFVENAFVACIPIIKYGDNPLIDDNTTIVGTLELIRNNRNKDIETIHYGQVVDVIPIIQSTIEGNYRVDLDTSKLTSGG